MCPYMGFGAIDYILKWNIMKLKTHHSKDWMKLDKMKPDTEDNWNGTGMEMEIDRIVHFEEGEKNQNFNSANSV